MSDKRGQQLASLQLSAMRSAAAKRDRLEAKARQVKAKELVDVVAAEDACARRWHDRGRQRGVNDVAQAWVETGVGAMRETHGKRDHVVMFAATHKESGHIGVSSSFACETTVALGALGRLVGQMNDWFERDGVEVRVQLRMTEHRAQLDRDDKLMVASEASQLSHRKLDDRGSRAGVPHHQADKGRHVPSPIFARPRGEDE